ncbi:hypothetical protein [Sulfitobacter sp.]|uniref:hypothetical protein n=1 Tax=Sulfitobacter sp. TaxID=1903071 RepID=UPI0030028E92
MNLPIEVQLTRPVEREGIAYKSLSFDEPDLDTQIAYAELEASFPEPKKVEQPDGSELAVHSPVTAAKVNRFWIARLSGVSEDVAGKIKDSDLDAVNKAVEVVLKFNSDAGDGVGGSSGNVPPAK